MWGSLKHVHQEDRFIPHRTMCQIFKQKEIDSDVKSLMTPFLANCLQLDLKFNDILMPRPTDRKYKLSKFLNDLDGVKTPTHKLIYDGGMSKIEILFEKNNGIDITYDAYFNKKKQHLKGEIKGISDLKLLKNKYIRNNRLDKKEFVELSKNLPEWETKIKKCVDIFFSKRKNLVIYNYSLFSDTEYKFIMIDLENGYYPLFSSHGKPFKYVTLNIINNDNRDTHLYSPEDLSEYL